MALTNHILPDSPTNNFATLNPLENPWFTHSNGNLATVRNGTSNGSWRACSSSIAVESDIWYYELLVSDGEIMAGVFSEDVNIFAANQPQDSQNSLGMVLYEGLPSSSSRIRVDSTFPSNISEKAAANTIIGFLVDFINTTFKVYFNGTLKHTASFSSSVIVGKKNKIVIVSYSGTINGSFYLNFGQDPTFGGAKSPSTTYPDSEGYGSFYYDPTQIASDVKALCTANLPEMTPDVTGDTPQDYFKAVTWTNPTSNDGTNASISTTFKPDLIWWKSRGFITSHYLLDSVIGYNKNLSPNNTTGQFDYSAIYGIPPNTVSNSGFEFNGDLDASTRGGTMVAWCWKAGGAPNTDGKAMVDGVERTIAGDAKLDAGTITPTRMSVNTKAGFSIVKYGVVDSVSTVPHGLTKQPEMIIFKNLNQSYNWTVYHKDLTSASYIMILNTTGAELNSSVQFNSIAPNESVFTIGTGGNTNYVTSTSDNIIAYCWHSVEGYSKFGSYIGTASSPFPFVYVGFRPALVIIKGIDDNGYNSYQSWSIFDTARNSHNPSNTALYANASWAEGMDGAGGSGGVGGIDILSNGFRILDGSASYSGVNNIRHIYMAFAEQPFNYANAR